MSFHNQPLQGSPKYNDNNAIQSKSSETSGISVPVAIDQRDPNADEWSQQVMRDLAHVRVQTPAEVEVDSILKANIPGNGLETKTRDDRGSAFETRESLDSFSQSQRRPQSGNVSTTTDKNDNGRLPLSHHSDERSGTELTPPSNRPQMEAAASTRTIDIAKKIPGGW